MGFLKSLWPTPFRIKQGDVASFIIQLVIFVVVCAVVGWLIAFLSDIAIIGVIFSIIGAALELYGIIGILLCVLKFIGVVK